MPVTSTARPILSDYLKGCSDYASNNKVRFNFATVDVGGTGSVGNIGIPLIWVNANTQFEVYVAQNISTAISTGGSPLPDGSVIAVAVGDYMGVGENYEDTDLTTADAKMTVLFRGDATGVESGFVWGSADATAQAAFKAQLEAQRITTIDNATVVAPTYN